MQTVYHLNANELDDRFLAGLKATYKDKNIEIIVCDVDETEYLLKSEVKKEDIENVDNNTSVEVVSDSVSQRRAFLKLPLVERRRILAQQAAEMVNHYQQNHEWKEWLTGDLVDY